MDVILVPIFAILQMALGLLIWALIIYVVLGWLIAFNVVNIQNGFVNTVNRLLAGVLEPMLSKIRSYVPSMGGLDLSPLVLIFGIYFVQMVIGRLALKLI